MTTMTWNADSDSKLLLFILASNPEVKIDYEAAAMMFSHDGVRCTVRAVQERLKKLRKQTKDDPLFNTAVGETSDPKSPTPKKSVQSKASQTPHTPSKRGAKDQNKSPQKEKKQKLGDEADQEEDDLV